MTPWETAAPVFTVYDPPPRRACKRSGDAFDDLVRKSRRALRQQQETPRVPVADAIIVAPLSKENFDPEVISIYGNPRRL